MNLVCDTALVYGFSDQQTIIARDLVDQVVADRAAGGLLPLRVAGKATHTTLAAV